jgi:hypothetical protein
MGTLYRPSDQTAIEVYPETDSFEFPAFVATHPAEAPFTDHEQDLPYAVSLGVVVDARRGAKAAEDTIAWLRASRRESLTYYDDDGAVHESLVLGTWSRARSATGTRLSLSLTERVEVASQYEAAGVVDVRQLRADVAAGHETPEDDGELPAEEVPGSALARAFDWASRLFGD